MFKNLLSGGGLTKSSTLDTTDADAVLKAAIAGLPQASTLPEFTPLALDELPTITPTQIAALQSIGLGDPSQFRAGQEDFIAMLQAQAAGRGGPSPAELQLKAAQDAQLRQAMALAASQSGRASPAVQRQLMQQQAMSGQQLAQQQAILRAQEQLAAQGLLGTSLEQARGGDIERTGLQADIDIASQAQTAENQRRQAELQQRADLERARQELDASKFASESDLEAQKLQAEAQSRADTIAANLAASALTETGALERQKLDAETKRIAAEQAAQAALQGAVLQGVGSLGAAAAGGI
jgi:hypothetical protein